MASKSRSRSTMAGKRFGDLVVGEYSRYPNFYLCKCDCGRTVEVRTSSIGLKLKSGLPVNCGECKESPKRRERRGYKQASADENPPAPCDTCSHKARCKAEEIACLAFLRYVQGKAYGEPSPPSREILSMAFQA